MSKIVLEWVENGRPKQRKADVLLYQLDNGSWGIEERAVRLVLAKEGGSIVLKAFLPREPRRDRWEERRNRRRRAVIVTSLVVLGMCLGRLLF